MLEVSLLSSCFLSYEGEMGSGLLLQDEWRSPQKILLALLRIESSQNCNDLSSLREVKNSTCLGFCGKPGPKPCQICSKRDDINDLGGNDCRSDGLFFHGPRERDPSVKPGVRPAMEDVTLIEPRLHLLNIDEARASMKYL